jgi:hypothetical protein
MGMKKDGTPCGAKPRINGSYCIGHERQQEA